MFMFFTCNPKSHQKGHLVPRTRWRFFVELPEHQPKTAPAPAPAPVPAQPASVQEQQHRSGPHSESGRAEHEQDVGLVQTPTPPTGPPATQPQVGPLPNLPPQVGPLATPAPLGPLVPKKVAGKEPDHDSELDVDVEVNADAHTSLRITLRRDPNSKPTLVIASAGGGGPARRVSSSA